MLSKYSLPYIVAPAFVAQSQTDQVRAYRCVCTGSAFAGGGFHARF